MFWNIGTLIGALLGSAIDPKTYGLDAAFPAAFVAMLWPLLRERRSALGRRHRRDGVPRADPVHAGRRADPVRGASASLVGVPAPPTPDGGGT